jgi:hypothetical protein
MDFPIAELRDEDACYERLVAILHPDGLGCPRSKSRDDPKVHRRHRAPVLDSRSTACNRAFNAVTETTFPKTHRRPSEICQVTRTSTRLGDTIFYEPGRATRCQTHLRQFRPGFRRKSFGDGPGMASGRQT